MGLSIYFALRGGRGFPGSTCYEWVCGEILGFADCQGYLRVKLGNIVGFVRANPRHSAACEGADFWGF